MTVIPFPETRPIGSRKEADEAIKLRCLDAKIDIAEILYDRAVEKGRKRDDRYRSC